MGIPLLLAMSVLFLFVGHAMSMREKRGIGHVHSVKPNSNASKACPRVEGDEDEDCGDDKYCDALGLKPNSDSMLFGRLQILICWTSHQIRNMVLRSILNPTFDLWGGGPWNIY